MQHGTGLAPVEVGHLDTFAPMDLAVAGFLARYRGTVFRDFRTDLKHFITWCERHGLKPLQARRPHLELYVRWLEDTGWASATVNRRFCTVALFYKYAALDGLIDRDPSIDVTRPKIKHEEQRRTFLTPLEFAGFLAAARKMGPMEHALAALLGMSGLRVAEACSLSIENLSIEAGYDTLRFVGKGGKAAAIPLPVVVMRAVREATAGRTEGPILLSKYGARMDRQCATRMVKRIAAKANVNTDISPHSLRRTFCTSGLVSGVPLRDMQIAMRHADPKTTTVYDMASSSPDRHAAQRVASYLAGMTG